MNEKQIDELIATVVEKATVAAAGERDELEEAVENLKRAIFGGKENKEPFDGYRFIGKLKSFDNFIKMEFEVSYDGYVRIRIKMYHNQFMAAIIKVEEIKDLIDRAYEVANVL